jgi:hypothetical protein
MDAAPAAAAPPTVAYQHLLARSPEALAAVAAAFSPAGLGLVLVRVPPDGTSALGGPRVAALAAARECALLPDAGAQRTALACNGLGSDVPLGRRHRGASTFSASYALTWPPAQASGSDDCAPCDPGFLDSHAARSSARHATPPLRRDLDAVGRLLVHVAALVARALDASLALTAGGNPPHRRPGPGPLESCVARSGAAKVRLVHYYSRAEGGYDGRASAPADPPDADGCARRRRGDLAALCDWQGWHFDHGLLTALCGPAYYSRCATAGTDEDVTDAVAASSDVACGLVVLRSTSPAFPGSRLVPVTVHVPADCVAVQVGEAAQILTGGATAATAHCVARPRLASAVCGPPAGDSDDGPHHQQELDGVSRSVCVAFLQPPWDECMEPPLPTAGPGAVPPESSAAPVLRASAAACASLAGLLPPLAERWAPGATFADFSKAVTRAYYGGRRR